MSGCLEIGEKKAGGSLRLLNARGDGNIKDSKLFLVCSEEGYFLQHHVERAHLHTIVGSVSLIVYLPCLSIPV